MLLSIKCSIRFNLLKYVSDSFEEKYEELKQDPYADEEDQDEYLAETYSGCQKKQGGNILMTMRRNLKLDKLLIKP